MSSRSQEHQKMIRLYKQETGQTDILMGDVAAWAKRRGWVMPIAPTDVEILAKQLSKAAREETRRDRRTGLPYRVNHAYKEKRGDEVLTFWMDIDENPARDKMDRSLKLRREQMVGDAFNLYTDAKHWSDEHPDQEPIQVELDFGPDVDWRLNGPREDDQDQRQAA